MIEDLQLQGLRDHESPMDPGFAKASSVASTPCDSALARKYSSLVGGVLYVSGWSRPDISFAVGILCRHVSNPTKAHWAAAVRVLGL